MDFTLFFHNNLDLPKLIKALGGVAWHPYYKDITKKMVNLPTRKICL